MIVKGRHYRTIWIKQDDPTTIQIIDQCALPHRFHIVDLRDVDAVAEAIRRMKVRGAGLLGASAGYGMFLAAQHAPQNGVDDYLEKAAETLISTRPTAVNIEWAVKRQLAAISEGETYEEKLRIARKTAEAIADEDAAFCHRIGDHGYELIRSISEKKSGKAVNILTHCNAGWLAFVDYGSATAPMYVAFERGVPIHVWVDETRPRNQGASLTSWELGEHGIPHHLVVDNVGGHLMQHGFVDIVIVGADRVTANGDAANKIGTYLKALAAADNNIPFYVALPSSTFDWNLQDGVKEIPIEERDEREITHMGGKTENGGIATVLICPETTPAKNYGFDVTPARLITGLITERGICAADPASIADLFPEQTGEYRET